MDVIIPVRDRAQFIAACLDSVRAQTLSPRAVIVVDDGSTDATPDILSTYARQWPALQIIRSVPRGVSHARNLGLRAAQAPFVAFLDSDDVWLPQKLEKQMALFAAGGPQLGFVHCGLSQIDATGAPLPGSRTIIPRLRGDIFRAMLEDFYHITGPSSVLARCELVLKVGGFDETLTCGEDIDLWLRLARIAHVDFVPDALVGLRFHPGGTYNRALRHNPELVLLQRLKIWNKWLPHIADAKPVLEVFRREAVETYVANVFKRHPDFGLYSRLKRSRLDLARRLFASRRDYLATMIRPSWNRIKYRIGRLILRSASLDSSRVHADSHRMPK